MFKSKLPTIPLLFILAQWVKRSIAGVVQKRILLMIFVWSVYEVARIWKCSQYSPFAWLYVSRILLISGAYGIAGCKYLFWLGQWDSQELWFSDISRQADKLGINLIQPAVKAFLKNFELGGKLFGGSWNDDVFEMSAKVVWEFFSFGGYITLFNWWSLRGKHRSGWSLLDVFMY